LVVVPAAFVTTFDDLVGTWRETISGVSTSHG